MSGITATAWAAEEHAHGDVSLSVSGGQIVTGVTPHGGAVIPDVRVFGWEFRENIDDPFTIGDPGFDAADGSGLPGSTNLQMNIVGPLQFWNGAGEPSLSNVAAGETLMFFAGAGLSYREIIIGGTGTPVTGNPIRVTSTDADGGIHSHINAQVYGWDENVIPAGPGSWGAGDGVEAAAGIYVVPVTLAMVGLADSDVLYFTFNNGIGEHEHGELIEYIESSVIPEPASLGLLGLGSLFLRRRR
jgi:hypothetical protein